jgi:hypothetical protein
MTELLVKPADLKPGDLIQTVISECGESPIGDGIDYIVTTVCHETNEFHYIKFDGLKPKYTSLAIPFNENTRYKIHRM